MSDPQPTLTPNVVIPNPQVRTTIGAILYVVSVVSGAASIVFLAFPDLAGSVDVAKIVATTNAVISFLSGSFGLGVTLPNIPR